MTGQKVSLSLKDVDQETGRDLNPVTQDLGGLEEETAHRNPDRPMSLLDLQRNVEEDEGECRKRVHRVSSPEKWELKQMISASCINRSELPDFDEETGGLSPPADNVCGHLQLNYTLS